MVTVVLLAKIRGRMHKKSEEGDDSDFFLWFQRVRERKKGFGFSFVFFNQTKRKEKRKKN